METIILYSLSSLVVNNPLLVFPFTIFFVLSFSSWLLLLLMLLLDQNASWRNGVDEIITFNNKQPLRTLFSCVLILIHSQSFHYKFFVFSFLLLSPFCCRSFFWSLLLLIPQLFMLRPFVISFVHFLILLFIFIPKSVQINALKCNQGNIVQ